jgi:hypothetical protein
MRFPMILTLLAGLTVLPVPAEESRTTTTEEILDAPGGRPVAILLPGAVARRGEEKDGYVRVVVEGWIRASSQAPSLETPSAPVVPKPAPAGSAAPEVAKAISGRITLKLATGEIRYAAGSKVLLLGDPQRLEVRRAELAQAYQTEGRGLREEIAALEARKAGALNSSENFTQASQNLDRAKSQLAAKNRELQALQAKFAGKEQALLEEFKTAETFADPGGVYRLEAPASGEYRVWASYAEGDRIYRWYLPAIVGSSAPVSLDLAAGKPGENPFLASP